MPDDMRANLPREIRIGPARQATQPSTAEQVRPAPEGAPSFKETLLQQLQDVAPDVRFSAHAQTRLAARNIQLSPTDLERIRDAIERAAEKGARDSLLVMEDLALVVSVKNRTVITAVDGPSRKDNVFTNIDSAVIV